MKNKKEKKENIEIFDGERILKCDRDGCMLISPCFTMEMKKGKKCGVKGYFFKLKDEK